MNKDTAWFEELYKNAEENHEEIPWAKLAPEENLVEYLAAHSGEKGRALVVGCGLGDDAKAIADAGFETTAIDISESAIKWATKRFEGANIDFQVEDLFALSESYLEAFDFVFECQTIQALPIAYRPQMVKAVASTLAKDGKLLIVANGKNDEEIFEGPPWPLVVNDVKLFQNYGLLEREFSIKIEPSPLSSLRFKAIYQKG